ncbi:hypothetical protein CASFOL_027455 [Castilleja foliolosa]|uniref:Transmembrane protein n=1 Tax=Castilleja foliolosa TaxID=1961234 RepID=A0ABD3CFU8_9LAMI
MSTSTLRHINHHHHHHPCHLPPPQTHHHEPLRPNPFPNPINTILKIFKTFTSSIFFPLAAIAAQNQNPKSDWDSHDV